MHEISFRAMGTDGLVLVNAPADAARELAELARARAELLEQCWSRFRDDSELSLLNAAAGQGPRTVSPDLLLLVQRMREAWVQTGGLFDPTVLTSVRAVGYDADFATVAARSAIAAASRLAPAPGLSAVQVDAVASTVDLPAGVQLDPGAIGKGLAADVIVDEVMSAGATGALVSLGGDLAVGGQDEVPWLIAVEDERQAPNQPGRLLQLLEFPDDVTRFGVATSTTLRRRWAHGRRHHVIDPRTGDVARSSDLVQVSVVEQSAWRAEALATALLLMPLPSARDFARQHDLSAFLLTLDGAYTTGAADV